MESKSGVLLGFCYGNRLDDADHYLVHGSNKQVFYKIFQSADDIDEEPVKKLLQEAVRVDGII